MITIQDIAYVRYGAPDLDAMRRFLDDFGLHPVERTARALYMRAAGPAPVVHVTELAPQAAPLGFGLRAASLEDLRALAPLVGAAVETNAEPGGGLVVRFTDPAGLRVDVVWGQTPAAPLAPAAAARAPSPVNRGAQRPRTGLPVRVAPAPSAVQRLGHVALHVKDFPRVAGFYRDTLGFRLSDSYWAGAPDNTVAVFLHCGLGEAWTDHHTIALIAADDGRTRFDHSAFEVLDLDDLMQGSAHLRQRGHQHSWGVGRHVQGSQIFDYWRDPFGNKIEHWTDGDVVNDSTAPTSAELKAGELAQWAPPLPATFFD